MVRCGEAYGLEARDISMYSPLPEEEVLLPPCSQFQIGSVIDQGLLAIITLVEVCSTLWIVDLYPPRAVKKPQHGITEQNPESRCPKQNPESRCPTVSPFLPNLQHLKRPCGT
eukprot:2060366-Amphidinium_carterae.1